MRMPFHKTLEFIGRSLVQSIDTLGNFFRFAWQMTILCLRPPWRVRLILTQAYLLGLRAMPVAMITALFVGMVIVLQMGYQLSAFNAKQYASAAGSKGLTQIMIPIFTALVVGARTAASIAAELGTMRVTEQIDAMEVLDVSPKTYLIVPRIIATAIMLPIITVYADVVGLAGGMLIGKFSLGISTRHYWTVMLQFLKYSDVVMGLSKTVLFGATIGLCGCYFGYTARGGAEGVGYATTRAVVVTLIALLLLEYVQSSWLIYIMDTFFSSTINQG